MRKPSRKAALEKTLIQILSKNDVWFNRVRAICTNGPFSRFVFIPKYEMLLQVNLNAIDNSYKDGDER
jgi:hypothetical protein